MVRQICRDVFFLRLKATEATPADIRTGRDLAETLEANRERCVGMAANMIGVAKRIIAFTEGTKTVVMYNPEITAKTGPYETEEGCLSLQGTRKTTRYGMIEVVYQDEDFRKRKGKYSGFTAQIIQHEVDHLNGILI